MNREGKKCVLYPRVSTEMQVDGYSLEGQKNGLKRFADREEMEIVGIYEVILCQEKVQIKNDFFPSCQHT